MNKKLVGIFVSMLMIVTALSVTGNTIFDDDQTDPVVLYDDWSMIVQNTTAEIGDIGHVIPINGIWAGAITQYNVKINYDPTEIEVTEINVDGCVGEGGGVTIHYYDDSVSINVYWINLPSGEGQLCNIVANIVTSEDPTISELTFNVYNSKYMPEGGSLTPTFYDGHIYIGSGTDSTPPVTTCTLDGIKEGDGYLSVVTATLEATDDASGVDYTMIKVDDGEYEEYSEPVVISDLGEHTIYFYSVDNFGNIEEEQNESFTIVSLFYDDWSMIVQNTTADPGDIGHIVPIYGIWDEDIQKYSFRINFDPTEIEVTEINVDGCVGEGGFGGPTYEYNSVHFYIYGLNVPAGAGQLANIVVNIISPTGAKFSDLTLTQAKYKPVGGSTDIIATKYNGHVKIDGDETVPPVTTCELSGGMAGDVYFSDVSVLLSATDDFSGVNYTMYKIDDGEWNTYEEIFSVSGNGDHTAYYYSVDMDGNEEDIKNCSFTIEYDVTPPETTCTLDGEMLDDVYIGPVTATLEATDDLAGVNHTWYKIDEGPVWQTYLNPFTISESGEHTVYYYSIDYAGNIEDEQSTTFTIEYQPELIIESITGGNGITAVIKNIGDGDATDVDWGIVIEGGLIILPKSAEGSFSTIAAGESEEVTMSVFGIGLGIITDIPEITVTAECTEGSSAEGSETASIFFTSVTIQ